MNEIKQWLNSERFKYISRPYLAKDVYNMSPKILQPIIATI